MESYNTYCMQCERRVDFEGEVVQANDGTTAAQGPCPRCGTVITAMLAAPRKS